jgi:transcription elongation factor Elf1
MKKPPVTKEIMCKTCRTVFDHTMQYVSTDLWGLWFWYDDTTKATTEYINCPKCGKRLSSCRFDMEMALGNDRRLEDWQKEAQ